MRRLLLFVFAMFTLVVLPESASATHVSCGDVITENTTLDSDLVDCPGPGVVIGAGGITFDLGGHTIAAAAESDGQNGVDNSGGHDGVTVTDGTISGFFAAVRFAGAHDGTLSHLSVINSQLWLTDSGRNLIERNDVGGIISVSGDTASRATLSTAHSPAGRRRAPWGPRSPATKSPGPLEQASPTARMGPSSWTTTTRAADSAMEN